jgi:hypothetical protein
MTRRNFPKSVMMATGLIDIAPGMLAKEAGKAA